MSRCGNSSLPMLTPEMFGAPAATADAIFEAEGADEPLMGLLLLLERSFRILEIAGPGGPKYCRATP